jgi:hypothetical protein
MKKVIRFFDKLEDQVRSGLSHWPIVYSLVGGIGIVLFWKGVWEWAEHYPVLFGPVSLLVGLVILLSTGLMVSFFIGDSIILSGLKHEKKLVERTEAEVKIEEINLQHVMTRLQAIEQKLDSFTK